MTPVFVAPVTAAINCCMTGVPVDGARKAYCGEMVMAIELVGTAMETTAVALFEGSAWLVAVSTMGFVVGTAAGAR